MVLYFHHYFAKIFYKPFPSLSAFDSPGKAETLDDFSYPPLLLHATKAPDDW
jgi:hypothetical protein